MFNAASMCKAHTWGDWWAIVFWLAYNIEWRRKDTWSGWSLSRYFLHGWIMLTPQKVTKLQYSHIKLLSFLCWKPGHTLILTLLHSFLHCISLFFSWYFLETPVIIAVPSTKFAFERVLSESSLHLSTPNFRFIYRAARRQARPAEHSRRPHLSAE